MAFGLDDIAHALIGAIRVFGTMAEVWKEYSNRRGTDFDVDRLLGEARNTMLKQIEDTDLALLRLEQTLKEKGTNIDRPLREIIRETSIWQPFESHKLSQIHKQFNHSIESIYSTIDDIEALVRCRQQTERFGSAVVAASRAKAELRQNLSKSGSFRAALEVLRKELTEQKAALSI